MTTAGPPSELQHVMTVAQARPQHRSSQLCFLFSWAEQEVPEDVRISLLFNEEVEACLGKTYFGAMVPAHPRMWVSWSYDRKRPRPTHETLCPRAFMINSFPFFLPSANEPDAEVFYVRHGDTVQRVAIADIVDQCYHLHRLMGCETCPRVGYDCLLDHHIHYDKTWRRETTQQHFPFLDDFKLPNAKEFEVPEFAFSDWEDLKLKNWEGRFAGHLVVPPLATSNRPLTPGTERLRVPYEHNFFKLEDTREELSQRAEAGVETRRRRQTECSKCYFGGTTTYYGRKTVHPCGKYAPRWCNHGAWTEEEMVQVTLRYVEAAAVDGQFSLDDWWHVAHVAGIGFPKRDPHTGRNREWVVSRVSAYGEQGLPCVVVRRTARNAQHEMVHLYTPDDVYKFLSKGTRLVWDEAKTKPRDDMQLAMWLQLACLTNGKRYSFYWCSKSGDSSGFGECAPDVGFVSLHSYGVHLQLWLSREKRDVYFGDFQEIYNRYERIPLFNMFQPVHEVMAYTQLYARV